MRIAEFKRNFKHLGGVYATDDIVLFRKPLELYNLTTGETIATFKDLNEAIDYEIEGKTLLERVSEWTEIKFPVIHGGNGGSSGLGNWTGKFSHAPHGDGDGRDKSDLPSRMNVKVNIQRNPEDTLKAFRETHVSDAFESGVTVDEQGFVTRYVHGGATSVGIWGGKGEMVYHNHPGEKGGNFSDSDLLSVSMTPAKGIVASGKEGDYIFVKTHRFNATKFTKAVKNATLRGKDYTDAVDRWLKRNQKKYGYTYTFKKA